MYLDLLQHEQRSFFFNFVYFGDVFLRYIFLTYVSILTAVRNEL